MRKNFKIWKRAWATSLLELICPIALMAILCLARLAVDKIPVLEASQLNNVKMIFPIGGYDQNGSTATLGV